MECLLEEKDLLRFIEDLPTNQELLDVNYIKQAKIAKNLIVKHVAGSHMNYIKDKNNAFYMWRNLVETFEPKSRAKRVLLKRRLNATRCGDTEKLDDYFLRFDKLVAEYCAAGGVLDDDDQVEMLLATLPDRFDNVVTVLETLDDHCTYDRAKTALLERELKLTDRKETSHAEQPSSSVAFSSHQGKFKQNHNKQHSKGKKKPIRCYNCGELNHKSPKCPKKETEGQDGPSHSSFAFVAGESKVVSFYIDSGATEHLIADDSLLSHKEELRQPFNIQVAKKETSLPVTHGGKLHLLSRVTSEREESVMDVTLDVFIAKGLRHNLLSVQKIESKGGVVKFADGKVIVSFQGKTVVVGYRRGRLYVVDFEMKNDCANVAESGNSSKSELWHRRLGHLGMSNVCKLVNGQLATGVKEKLDNSLPFCDPCVKGTMTRLPFKKTRPPTRRPLERIHSDVCGPMETQAIGGSRYFVTFTDDFTHMTVTYLMSNKSETFSKFKEYHAMATAHFNLKISKLRSDRGGEYSSEAMKEFCRKNGIILEMNSAHNPESNGVSERINRTLVGKARSMLFDAGLPKHLWGEAMIAATYLTNRSPTVALNNKTPFEMWFNRKPDISNLRVFGSRAFAHDPNVKKFDQRGDEYRMVGYDHSGYRLYDGHKVMVRRNVVFDEGISEQNVVVQEHLSEVTKTGESLNTNINHKSPLSRSGNGNRTPRTVENSSAKSPQPGSIPETGEEESSASEEEFTTPRYTSTPTNVLRRNPVRNCRNMVPRRLEDYELHLALSAISWVKDEPLDYKDVLGREDEDLWQSAIDSELNSLAENETWELVPKPKTVKLLGTRWVFRIKQEPNGEKKYKARLVVRGFQQREGIDFFETYAPVARLPTIRLILALATQKQLFTRHLDVTTAFLYGNLEEIVYLRSPDGVEIPEGQAIRLKKSLYGLRQSPKCWNIRFNDFITSLGFIQSKSDYCLYVWTKDAEVVYLVIYVDDTLIAGTREETISDFVKRLSSEFKMKDLGPVRRFMGLNVNIKEDSIEIDQSHYVR